MNGAPGLLIALTLCLAGCSGRYEVGVVGTGQATAGGSSTGGARSAGGAAGVEPTAGATDPGQAQAALCAPASDPPPVTGPFADPEVVWGRLSLLIYGEARPAPLPIPTSTTPEWAREIATAAIAAERADTGKVRGIELFLERWGELRLSPLQRNWAAIASEPEATLATLVELPDPEEPQRLGFFNDRVWLATHRNISDRARIIMGALLNADIPAPPAGVELTSPDIGGTRRQNLTFAVVEPNCKGCHDVLDPLGLALEHFDAMGDFRTMERGEPIDASGRLEYGMVATGQLDFDAWQDLAPRLASSCDVAVGVALEFYEFGLPHAGRTPYPDQNAGSWEDNLEQTDARRVVQTFMREGRRIEALPLSLAQTEAFLK